MPSAYTCSFTGADVKQIKLTLLFFPVCAAAWLEWVFSGLSTMQISLHQIVHS